MAGSNKIDSRQSKLVAATSMVGSAANDTLDTIFPKIDAELAKLFEDRNVMLTDGGVLSFTGTQVQFTEDLNITLNQKISGAVPQVISLGSANRIFTNSGDMLVAAINRTAGTATLSIVISGSSLPAASSANQEVFLIAKRVDAGDGTKRLYFRDGTVLDAGQSFRLGSAAASLPLTVKGDLLGYDTAVNRVPIGTNGQVLTVDSVTALGLKWATPTTALNDITTISNLSYVASVSAGAITIALKTLAGTDPSILDPITISIKTGSATNPTVSFLNITSAKSITIPAGASLGFKSGINADIYLYLQYDGSSFQLAVSAAGYYRDNEIQNTSIISAGATSPFDLYGATFALAEPTRMIGRSVATFTAGTWTSISTLNVAGNQGNLVHNRPYGFTKITSGSGTYFVSPGVWCVTVEMVGGGGGGSLSGSITNTAGQNGTATTFGSLTCGGGSGAIWEGAPATGGTASGSLGVSNAFRGNPGDGYVLLLTACGGTGGSSPFGGAGAGGNGVVGSAGSAVQGNTGSGGGGGGILYTLGCTGGGGGAGAYAKATIVTPAASYSYSVGSGGAGGVAGANGFAGGAGGSGYIFITEYYSF